MIAQQKSRSRSTDQVRAGVVVVDGEGLIRWANPTGQGYLALLADANIGSYLTDLGDRQLWELFGPPPQRRGGHEVTVKSPRSRVFEVNSQPTTTASTGDSWTLIIHEIDPA